ncbi:hypothetical protein K466DRAFT_501975 [Polyporus arcularius HHB13444]|uniref:Uncharacterized protein n=1 Tax=Polyporus arcularius HHB13444 TaxID=1314778 RepID=A0A5C3NYC2_9APHY|nr:hypothetical protein K466DRAFT_501975 [Polyporus arcularius HHB13444]
MIRSQTVGRLVHGSKENEAVVRDLVNVPAVKRIANFGNACLQRFGPNLYKSYDEVLTDLCDRDPTLYRNWPNNVFACATFNVGSRTTTVKHTDHLNLSYGWCVITAIGNYDPTRGGHAVLWELRMVIEFPPLRSILIPSAVVSHSNTDIADGEVRYSLTQYSAGGLFRWVAAGHQTLKSLRAKGGRLTESGEEHWKRGVGLLSMWDELQAWWRSL